MNIVWQIGLLMILPATIMGLVVIGWMTNKQKQIEDPKKIRAKRIEDLETKKGFKLKETGFYTPDGTVILYRSEFSVRKVDDLHVAINLPDGKRIYDTGYWTDFFIKEVGERVIKSKEID